MDELRAERDAALARVKELQDLWDGCYPYEQRDLNERDLSEARERIAELESRVREEEDQRDGARHAAQEGRELWEEAKARIAKLEGALRRVLPLVADHFGNQAEADEIDGAREQARAVLEGKK